MEFRANGATNDRLLAGIGVSSVSAVLTACGGGGGAGTPDGGASPQSTGAAGSGAISSAQAARFLSQAGLGASHAQIQRVQTLGYAAWIDEQMALPSSMTRCDWLISQGFDAAGNKNSLSGFDACVWRKLLSSPDVLRQRVTLALSEITVVSVLGLSGGWRAFSGAHFLDVLEANAFGNYRALLGQVSMSPAMGEYLTFRGNVKYNPKTGAMPDENYARELMQLFSIGLLQLNLDGTPKLVNGKTVETYSLDDITGLARIFTGWDWDYSVGNGNTPDFQTRPMIQVAARHETNASTFLGTTVPPGLDGASSLSAALDIIFAHPNVAPFISRQLIQRLVSSNPSPQYVSRVAQTFLNDGSGTKGNLAAVIKAILLDDDARQDSNLQSLSFGKLREPVLRFVHWARAFGATSPSDAWAIGDTSNPGTRLGQSPLRSPTVFNFFRPGYVPPNSAIAAASQVAPEFQLTNESSVVGYLNFMQSVITNGIGDVKADYTAWLAMADDAATLIADLVLVLSANQLDTAATNAITTSIQSMPSGTDAARANRVYAAILLVMASPAYLIQK